MRADMPLTAPLGPEADVRPARGRTIVFCREVPWATDLPISTRRLGGLFARAGWNVVWLTPPLAPQDLLRRTDPAILRQHRAGGARYEQGRVLAYTARTLAPHTLRLPIGNAALARRIWRWCVPSVRSVLRQAGLDEPDVLWLSHIKALGLPDLFPGVPVVWHMTDHYPSRSASRRRCADLCRLNLQRADRLLFSSPGLAERAVQEFGLGPAPVAVLPHGVDSEMLGGRKGVDPLDHIPSPRVAYVGNTDRADVELLARIADEGAVDLVVIGRREPFREAGGERLHLLGPQPPEVVGRLLPWCDAGLVSYKPAELAFARAGGNPMKVYEYAAAGLPVLAPEMAVFAWIGAPVHTYDSASSLLRLLPLVLAHRDELGRKARAWAAENTWERRYQEAAAVVEDLLAGPSGPQPRPFNR